MKPTPRIYLDTNVFVTAYATRGEHSEDAWWLLDHLERGAIEGITSELTAGELLTGPVVRNETDLVEDYKILISDRSSLEVVKIDRSILIRAAEIHADARSLRLPDAIHIDSAASMNCSHLLSADRRLPPVAGLRHLSLGTNSFSQVRHLLG